MKKIFIGFLTAVISIFELMSPTQVYAAEKPTVSALAAVLISADTGEIVYAVNHDKKLPVASTTKIMTTLLLLESGSLDDPFVVDSDAIKVEGSSMGLVEGDIVTKYALCCGMLLPSGNDAANSAAICVAGSLEGFAEMMNERAEKIGMTRSFFVTPSGLDENGNGASAYDMAILAREALKNDTFREICGSETIKLSFGNPPYDRWLKNTNRLLSMYDGVYGVKTGFTDDAGRCLVSACERDGKNLICVTLNAPNDWQDHIAMYDYGFNTVKTVDLQISDEYTISVVGGNSNSVAVKVAENPIICTAMENFDNFSYKIISSPFVYAPICEGDQLGELEITYSEKISTRVPIYAAENCERKEIPPQKQSFLQKIISKLKFKK